MNISETLTSLLIWFSGVTFLVYGSLCLFAGGMTDEFKRYGLSKFRKMVGFLELIGGLGCIIGIKYPTLLLLSSAGLTVLMLLGVLVRLKIKDSFILILPAAILMIVNAYIFQNTL